MEALQAPSPSGDEPPTPRYHAFLLRLWCDGEAGDWRASLQAPGEAERRGYADLEELIDFLRDLCGPPGGSPDRRSHAP